jgi:tetratricopeptide (TPR) repeat protein
MFEIGINIGNCYLELKQYEKAIKTYKTVVDQFKGKSTDIESNKIVSQLYASIGDIFMRQNKLIKAEQYFKKSIAMDQSDPALAYNIAEIMFSAGKTNDSIKYYKMAIKIKPDWGIAYKQLGYVYLNKGNIKTAIKMLKKFLKLAPKSPDAPGVKEVIKSLK